MNKPFCFSFLRIVVLLCVFMGVYSCCKGNKENEPVLITENDTQRGFSKKSDDVVVEMPEEVVYIKDDVNRDVLDYNEDTGTISFHNSEDLERQNIKAGDILYSSEQTVMAPDGYCLRVVSVSKQGETVTFQTEPASLLEAFDHLEEKGTMVIPDVKPEDLMVYTVTAGEENTKGLDININPIGVQFSHTEEESSLSWVFYRQTCKSDPNKVAFQATLGVTLYHTMQEDKSTILLDSGTMVLYTEAQMGATVTLTLESGPELSEEDAILEASTVKNNLLDKKWDIPIFTLPSPFTNVIVRPSVVLSLQFGLDIEGNITVETGITKTTCAFNFENSGYYLPEFKQKSYARALNKVTPIFRVKASAEMSAYASVGPGFRLEIPSLRIKDEGKSVPSYVGLYALGTIRGEVNVGASYDPFSGSASVTCSGGGEFVFQLAAQGKMGFKERSWADFDCRWDAITVPLDEWNWTYLTESPMPYNLDAQVDGADAILSWESNQGNRLQKIVYDVYVDKGEGLELIHEGIKEKSAVFTSKQDGIYHWAVVARSVRGKTFTSNQETFSIITTSPKTNPAVIDRNTMMAVITGSVSSRNKIKEYGFSFFETEEISDDCHDSEVKGTPDNFSLDVGPLYNHYTYYVRAYAKLDCPGGQELKVYGNVEKIMLDEDEVHIAVSPGELKFGDVAVGDKKTLELVVINEGIETGLVKVVPRFDNLPITFEWNERVIKENGGRSALYVTYEPDIIRDEWKAYVSLEGYDKDKRLIHQVSVPLSGSSSKEVTAKPIFRFSEYSAPFGPVEIGQEGQITRTIYNVGTADLVITSVKCEESAFTTSWKSATIKPDDHKEVTIYFRPTEERRYQAKMEFVCNVDKTDDAKIGVTGTGTVPPEAKIRVSPTSLVFEDTKVGQTSEMDWTITNIGGATLTVSSLTVPDGFSTDFASWSPKTVEPTKSHTFKVYFKPKEVKTYSGKMVFKSNAVNAQNQEFTIGGKGISAGDAKISVSPNTVQFGEKTVGKTAEQTVTITNKGNAPLVFTSVTSPDNVFSTDFGSWTSKTLAAGASCSLKVYFTPAAVRSYSTSISIKTNASNAPDVALPVSGAGISANENGAKISTGSAQVEFSTIPRGIWSDRICTIYNKGNAPLTISSINCPDGLTARLDKWSSLTIAAGEYRSVTIEFHPTIEKSYNGNMVIVSDAVDHPSLSVPVVARCGNDGDLLGFSSDVINFGNVVVGNEHLAQLVVTNKSNRSIGIYARSSLYGGGITSAPSGDDYSSLASGASVSYIFGFKPVGYYNLNESCTIRVKVNINNTYSYENFHVDMKGAGVSKGIYKGNAVDLGLSVKWADCNLGGGVPEDYGDFYAWGEVDLKPEYTSENYKWKDGSKYNSSNPSLKSEDDVAQKKLGGLWRMPTKEECSELLENCTIIRTTKNGKTGYLLTSKINGNTLFFPVTNSIHNGSFPVNTYFTGTWANALYNTNSASLLHIEDYEEDGGIYAHVGGIEPGCGMPVRPIYEEGGGGVNPGKGEAKIELSH